MTRAFGDTEFKPELISSEPEVLRTSAAAMELSADESGGTIPEQTGRLCCGREVRCLEDFMGAADDCCGSSDGVWDHVTSEELVNRVCAWIKEHDVEVDNVADYVLELVMAKV